MYDFGDHQPGADGTRETFPKPPLPLTVAELGRLAVEYPWSALLDAITPSRSEGEGRPVLVLPGFYANDGLTRRLRVHLRKLGYRAHGWGLGRNYGLTDDILAGVLARLDELHERYRQPVSVVGWSFGGLLARWLAHERPDQVRQVICLGSPWRAEGERTRSTRMFERAARDHGLSERARDVVATLRGDVPVLCTAIWSRSDGIVNWRGCALDDGPNTENVSVPSSHVGLVSNPLSLAAVADRLAQDPDHPQPFSWATCVRRVVPGMPVPAPATAPRITDASSSDSAGAPA